MRRSIATAAALLAIVASAPHAAEAAKKKAGQRAPAAASPVVPQRAIDAIASHDLAAAVLALRDEPQSPRINYIIRAATSIALDEIGESPSRSEAHKHYQNLAVAYHNLFLFLKSHGTMDRGYFDKALKSYKKAKRAGTVLHKAECDLLSAALHASMGEREKALKMFGKIDDILLRSDFESMEYLAAYHAAMGDAAGACEALAAAFRINPAGTVAWIEVGDDFHDIEDDPQYRSLVASMSSSRNADDITLCVPPAEGPKLEMPEAGPAPAPKGKPRK
ncbi:MAG: hypothetical protein JXA24_04305, partial [Proteobacteria bacterium]|nr:hypothetical protein [Pseudomonadota bacterium]